MLESDFLEKALGEPEMSHYPFLQSAIFFPRDFSSVHLFIKCQAIMSGQPAPCLAGDVPVGTTSPWACSLTFPLGD